MKHELNLAKQPFLNPRPVLRVALVLWVLGLAVAAFNVRLYLKHYSGSSTSREREQALRETLTRERAAVQELETELAGYDVAWQNEQSKFLNTKIAQRTFSWSELFDRLGEAMPADIRLHTLTPSFGEGRGRRTTLAEGEALLVIRGQARSSQVVLEFVDALFAHSDFRAPDLTGEALQETGLIDFGLSVIYAAGWDEQAAPVEAGVEGEEEEGGAVAEAVESDAPATETDAETEDDADDAAPLTTEARSE